MHFDLSKKPKQKIEKKIQILKGVDFFKGNTTFDMIEDVSSTL